jgi:hypothetical protein
MTMRWLIFVGAFAAWAAVVFAALSVAGAAWTGCAPNPNFAPAAACSWGIDWLATVPLLLVLWAGAKALKLLAARLGISLD